MYVFYQSKDVITVTAKSLMVRIDNMRYKVWLPKKLTATDRNSDNYKTFLPEKFKFTVVCEDKEYKFSSFELKSAFDGVLPEELRGDKSFRHTPEIIIPRKVKVIDSLKR